MGTDSYDAGLDTSNVQMAYAIETDWGVLPAVAFQQIRVTAEAFAESKNRTRPLELNPGGYAIQAITTQDMAKGSINFGLSYGTFDDLIASAMNSSWSSALDIVGVSGDITAVAASGELTSTTSGKFSTVAVGQWIRTYGFTNAANNGIWQVTAVASETLTLANATGVLVDETPTGANAHITGSFIQNSNVVTTFQMQKELSDALFLLFAGCYVSSTQLTMEVGKFVEGTMDFLVKGATALTTDSSTGDQVAAPTGRIIDNITGFKAFLVDGSAPTAVLQSITLTVAKQRSASQYGIGSAVAVGMRRGTLEVDGKLSLFFNNFTYYDDFKSETALTLSWQLVDDAGNTYVFTLPAVTIMNPSVVAKGLDQDIIAEFDLEGNPASSTANIYPNVTIQIDRLPIPS